MELIKGIKTISNGESHVQYVDELGDGVEVVLFNLYVNPTQRGEYFGHNLIKEAMDDIFGKGYEKILLIAKKDWLVRYYEKLGFIQQEGTNEMYFTNEKKMDINSLIERAHKNALDHGFYECDFNMARSVMLVVSEIGEAMEAERKGEHTNVEYADDYLSGERTDGWFDLFVKDNFEDEIADIFIRIFDLMGHEKMTFIQGDIPKSKGLYEDLRLLTIYVVSGRVTKALHRMQALCKGQDINIEQFILAKMKYNENRPYKHGKKY